MSSLSFFFARWILSHYMRIVYVVAILFVVGGLAGPRYGAPLFVLALGLARGGVLLAFAIWIVVVVIRRRRPEFKLQDVVTNVDRWGKKSRGARIGFTALIASLAAMFACLGGLIGTLGVYVVWRLT